MPVKPFAPRHSSKEIEDRLITSIPSRKSWYLIISLSISIVAVAAEMFIGLMVIRGISLAFIWIAVWTIVGAFVIYIFLWQIFGKEEIQITVSSITISKIVITFRRSKEYANEYIKDLRISPMGMNEGTSSRLSAAFGYGGGIIVFDYGAGTIRMGSNIDEAEGKQIIAEIQQKFPQYKN
jgi:hypothetical protein